jgi:hypothetical protein
MPDLWHLTVLTGHTRTSPRSEVADHVVSGLQTSWRAAYKAGAPPWLVVGLLPDGMVLLGNQPDLMLELGYFERCVAWALLESQPSTNLTR